jgi:hypothetical protein
VPATAGSTFGYKPRSMHPIAASGSILTIRPEGQPALDVSNGRCFWELWKTRVVLDAISPFGLGLRNQIAQRNAQSLRQSSNVAQARDCASIRYPEIDAMDARLFRWLLLRVRFGP